MNQKPPLGLIPTRIWESAVKSERLVQVQGAIARYVTASKEVPVAWYEEEKELLAYFKEE